MTSSGESFWASAKNPSISWHGILRALPSGWQVVESHSERQRRIPHCWAWDPSLRSGWLKVSFKVLSCGFEFWLLSFELLLFRLWIWNLIKKTAPSTRRQFNLAKKMRAQEFFKAYSPTGEYDNPVGTRLPLKKFPIGFNWVKITPIAPRLKRPFWPTIFREPLLYLYYSTIKFKSQ